MEYKIGPACIEFGLFRAAIYGSSMVVYIGNGTISSRMQALLEITQNPA